MENGCFTGDLSEQVAWLFVTRQFGNFVDKQDLLDFVTYEKDPERIKLLAKTLCKRLNEEPPPEDQGTLINPSLLPGLQNRSTRLARRLNSQVQSASRRLADKVAKEVERSPTLVSSLRQEQDPTTRLHTLVKNELLTPKEAASVKGDFQTALQVKLLDVAVPGVTELVLKLKDPDVREKAETALASPYIVTSLKVLVAFLERCRSRWSRMLRYVKYNLTDWYTYFGRKKQPKCGDSWKEDLQTLNEIIVTLQREGQRV